MLYKIRCNPVHPLNGSLPGPYVPVRVTRGALVSHRYTYAPPRCRTLQYSRTFIHSQCPSETILQTPYSMVWDWRVSRPVPMLLIGLSCSIPTIVFCYFSLSLLSDIGWYCGAGVFGLIRCISLSLSLALPTFFLNLLILLRKPRSWTLTASSVVRSLFCFPQSRCNSVAFRTSVLPRLLLDLDTFSILILWVCFLYF